MRNDGLPHSGLARVQVTVRPTRRDVLKLGMVAAAGMVGLTGLTACGAVPEKPDQSKPQVRGGSYSHGATGGGLKAYFPDKHLPIVSGGPFTISKFQEKGTTVFRANPHFYGPHPHVQAITLTYYTNASSMLADFDGGNLDAVDQVPFQAASVVKSASGAHMTTVPGSNDVAMPTGIPAPDML